MKFGHLISFCSLLIAYDGNQNITRLMTLTICYKYFCEPYCLNQYSMTTYLDFSLSIEHPDTVAEYENKLKS